MTKGIINISEDAKKQIDLLHSYHPEKEWSGVLVYITRNGDFSAMKDFDFEVLGVYPMDLGKASYTEFDYNESIAEIYDIFEKEGYSIEELKTGMIHSHHNMKSYFSGTDIDELKTNARKHNYYLSLVVSLDEDYAAKVAFPSKVEVQETHYIKDSSGNDITIPVNSTKESVLTIDLDIVLPEKLSQKEWFTKRIADLKTPKTVDRGWNKYGPGYGRGFYDRDYYGRNYRQPVQQSLWPSPSKGTEEAVVLPSVKEKLKLEDFILELGEEIFDTKFVSIQSLVRTLLKNNNISDDMYVLIEKEFSPLFSKFFGKSPEKNAESEEIITNIILMLDEYSEDLIKRPENKFPEDNMYEEFKLSIYEQIP